MIAMYGFLDCMVPDQSTDPKSEWVILKKKALAFFPVYTRVTVRRAVDRYTTWSNINQAKGAATVKYNLIVERNDERNGLRRYQIDVKNDSETGAFVLTDTTYQWELINYGICWYQGRF